MDGSKDSLFAMKLAHQGGSKGAYWKANIIEKEAKVTRVTILTRNDQWHAEAANAKVYISGQMCGIMPAKTQ